MQSLLRIGALAATIVWALPAQAATVFSENFEVTTGQIRATGGDTPPLNDLQAKGWGFVDSGVTDEIASIVSTTSRTGSPTKAIRFRYGFMNHLVGGPCGNASDCKNVKLTRFFPGMTDMWTRAYYRFEKVDPTAPSFHVKYPTLNNAKVQYFNPGIGESVGTSVGFHSSWDPDELFAFASTSFLRYCRAGGTVLVQTCNYYPNTPTRVKMTIHNSPTDRPTQWACVEVHYKGNYPLTSYNGLFQVWVNDVQTINYVDLKFFTETPNAAVGETNTFRYVQLYRQSSENLFRYEDDWEIATTRIGCSGGGGPAGDTTAPATPLNFTVR